MIPSILFVGAVIIFMIGFFTGMWLLGLHWQDKEDERQKKEDEYHDGVAKRKDRT